MRKKSNWTLGENKPNPSTLLRTGQSQLQNRRQKKMTENKRQLVRREASREA
jgi:hypothetical protein